jgi:hypothetical protein
VGIVVSIPSIVRAAAVTALDRSSSVARLAGQAPADRHDPGVVSLVGPAGIEPTTSTV